VLGNPKPIQKIRQRLLPQAQGTVLEVGVGPGVNFPYYDPAKVKKTLRAGTQSRNGRARREANDAKRSWDVEFLVCLVSESPCQRPAWIRSFSTFTLCTIPGVADAIRGIGHVLRPGGRFLFFEHGLSPDIRVRRWQERTEPLFQWAFEGCHVDT